MTISSEFPYESQYVSVLDARMHYVESGEGDPILFLHGNPTSSYLWRNIIPAAARHGRAIAVDLIGMGRSDKPDIEYRFFDHLRYLEGFVEALDLHDVRLVLHDWGGGLGTSWARRHDDDVRAIAYMEAVIKPMAWSVASVPERLLFRAMRDRRIGDWMNLRGSFFIDRLLPMMVERSLPDEVKAAYKAPFPTPASRLPVATWPREIPFDGAPADVHEEIGANYRWLREAAMPKLLLHVRPGAIIKPAMVEELERDVPGLESVAIGSGRHYIQEDIPDAIGDELERWLQQPAAAEQT
jgi:haloalkane dehalogenase